MNFSSIFEFHDRVSKLFLPQIEHLLSFLVWDLDGFDDRITRMSGGTVTALNLGLRDEAQLIHAPVTEFLKREILLSSADDMPEDIRRWQYAPVSIEL